MQPDDPRPFAERLASLKENPHARRQWLYLTLVATVLTAVACALLVGAARDDLNAPVGLAILLIPAAGFLWVTAWCTRSIMDRTQPPEGSAEPPAPQT